MALPAVAVAFRMKFVVTVPGVAAASGTRHSTAEMASALNVQFVSPIMALPVILPDAVTAIDTDPIKDAAAVSLLLTAPSNEPTAHAGSAST